MKDSFSQLLHHVTVAVVLSLRLYTLPLVYIIYGLARTKLYSSPIMTYSSQIRYLPRPQRLQPEDVSAQQWLMQGYRNMTTTLLTPFRLGRNLYRLAIAVEQYPGLLHHERFSGGLLQRQYASIQSSSGTTLASEEIDPNSREHASASQVYHAALLSNETLENVLSTFSPPDTSKAVEKNHLYVSVEQEPVHKHLCSNSSIQTTPEDKLRKRSVSEDEQTEADMHTGQDLTHIAARTACDTHSTAKDRDSNPQNLTLAEVDCQHSPYRSRGVDSQQQVDIGMSCKTPGEACVPVTRPCRSKLPTRRIGRKEKEPVVSSEVLDDLQPANDNGAIKRKKLQRRPRC